MTTDQVLETLECKIPVPHKGLSAKLVLGDANFGLATLPTDSVDVAIVDPPYGASYNTSWGLPKMHGLNGFGGEWKIADHEWDRLTSGVNFQMTIAYLEQLKRIVKPSGSFFIHSTYHNSGIVNVACQILGIEIINEIVWYKRNAFPNLANRRLTASHETILWVHTGKPGKRAYRFNAEAVKASFFDNDGLKARGKQMRTVWDIPNNKTREELAFGKHPTQKPLSVAARLLLMTGIPNGDLIVPFAGSGTEMIAGLKYGMNVCGFESERQYFDLAQRRISAYIESDEQLELGIGS